MDDILKYLTIGIDTSSDDGGTAVTIALSVPDELKQNHLIVLSSKFYVKGEEIPVITSNQIKNLFESYLRNKKEEGELNEQK